MTKENYAEQTGTDDLNVHFSLKIKSESLPFVYFYARSTCTLQLSELRPEQEH